MFNIRHVFMKHTMTKDKFCQCTWWCKNFTLAQTGRNLFLPYQFKPV